MACESCKAFLREACEELDIKLVRVELGEITTKEEISDDDKRQIHSKLKKAGLKLLE